VLLITVLLPAEMSVLLADRVILLGDWTVIGTLIVAPPERTNDRL
jgi:hypothetical protein